MSDDPTQLMTLLQNDPGAARELVEANLAQQAAGNPMLAMMMQMMQSRRSDAATERDVRSARVERVRSRFRELRDALDGAQDLLEDLAGALGACADCWGTDDGCSRCRGRGGAGWQPPDDDLFDELVAPAIKRRLRGATTKGNDE